MLAMMLMQAGACGAGPARHATAGHAAGTHDSPNWRALPWICAVGSANTPAAGQRRAAGGQCLHAGGNLRTTASQLGAIRQMWLVAVAVGTKLPGLPPPSLTHVAFFALAGRAPRLVLVALSVRVLHDSCTQTRCSQGSQQRVRPMQPAASPIISAAYLVPPHPARMQPQPTEPSTPTGDVAPAIGQVGVEEGGGGFSACRYWCCDRRWQ